MKLLCGHAYVEISHIGDFLYTEQKAVGEKLSRIMQIFLYLIVKRGSLFSRIIARVKRIHSINDDLQSLYGLHKYATHKGVALPGLL